MNISEISDHGGGKEKVEVEEVLSRFSDGDSKQAQVAIVETGTMKERENGGDEGKLNVVLHTHSRVTKGGGRKGKEEEEDKKEDEGDDDAKEDEKIMRTRRSKKRRGEEERYLEAPDGSERRELEAVVGRLRRLLATKD